MSKPKKIKLPRFTVPLFEHTSVFFARNADVFAEFCERHNVPCESIEFCGGLTLTCFDEQGRGFYVVAVFDADPATLAHECCHATFHALSDVGVMATTNEEHLGNETFCYLMGRMFNAFYPMVIEEQQRLLAEAEAEQVTEQLIKEEKPKKASKPKAKPIKEEYVPRIARYKRG